MIIFVASYATGLGNVPWQQGELFGLEGGSHPSFMFPTRQRIVISSRHRHIPLNSHKLGRQSTHRLHLSLANGCHHTFRRIRVLRRALLVGVAFRSCMFPRDGWAKLRRGEDGVSDWVWDSGKSAVEGCEKAVEGEGFYDEGWDEK